MNILLDMDGVLANFDQGVMDEWQRRYPDEPLRPYVERQEFFIDHDHPDHMRPRLEAIYRAPGFFRALDVIPGSQAAVQAMLARGWQVAVCTAPLLGVPTCMSEKHDWLAQHFGDEMARRMIIALDKTVVRGDILIDDRPQIVGQWPPQWEHVIYDHPYNRQAGHQRRLTWADWQDVLAG